MTTERGSIGDPHVSRTIPSNPPEGHKMVAGSHREHDGPEPTPTSPSNAVGLKLRTSESDPLLKLSLWRVAV